MPPNFVAEQSTLEAFWTMMGLVKQDDLAGPFHRNPPSYSISMCLFFQAWLVFAEMSLPVFCLEEYKSDC